MGKTRNTGKLATQIQFDNSNNLVIGNSTSSSFNTSGSVNAIGGITGSIFGIGDPTSFSASISSNLVSIQSITASNIARLSNLETKSASVDISITNINSVTASNIARLNNLETKSASVDITISSINSKTGSYATTGSNSFYGTQVFSGSVYIANDLIVQGSSSIQYISASSVSIGTNIVQLNTANPSVRFAGLTVIDSGSVGGSGSFLYDSLQDEFIFVHRGNGTNVTSSHFVLGPETYDSLGNELYLTCNTLSKGTGKEHLVDSCIFDNGTTVCVNANLIGSGNACITSVCSPTFIGGTLGLNTTTADYAATITNVQDSSQGLLIRATDNDTTLCLLSLQGSAGASCQTWVNRLVVTKDGTKYFGNPAGSRLQMNASGENFYQYTNNYYIWGLYNDANSLSIESAFGGCIIFRTDAQTISSSPTTTVERMRITNSGNVGIGTTTPGDVLHIEKCQAGGMGMIIRNACGATSNTSMCSLISLQLVGAGQTGQLGANLIAGKEGDYSSAGVRNAFFAIQTACGDNLYERLRITSSGNVGIGTIPGSILHVKGGTAGGADFGAELRVWENSFGAVLQGFTYGTTASFLGNFRYNINTPASSVTNYYQAGHGILFHDGVHILSSNPGGTSGGTFTPSKRLTILNNGNVGIGTCNPGSKLSVEGALQVNGTITNTATGTDTYTQSTWYLDTSNQILFENGRTTNSASGTGRTVYFTWRGGPGYGGGVQLQHGANAWAAYTSDARMKTKVADVENGMESIMKLTPIKFKWTRELEKSRTITGFTAQNVGEAIPEAIFNSWKDDELGDVKSYYQDYLIPYLVKGIQEQQCIICSQSQKIALMESCIGIV